MNDTVDKGSDIIQFDSMMKVVARTGRTGSVNEPALRFHDFAIDDEENIYTCETGNKKIRKFKKASAR